jgi:hypothetical protein
MKIDIMENTFKDEMINSILKTQYFPHVYSEYRELPSCFSTIGLSTEIMNEISQISINEPKKFKTITSRFKKFDKSIRLLEIPHILPYMKMASKISQDVLSTDHIYKNAQLVIENSNLEDSISKVRPDRHKDGRIFILNSYGEKDSIDYSIGKNFLLHVDIRRCFSSIKHDILLKQLPEKCEFDDRILANYNNGYNVGIPTGPALSNILAEILLQKITEELEPQVSENGSIARYIDDFKYYCNTKEEADKFLTILNSVLDKYGFEINNKKTELIDLTINSNDPWIDEISLILPSNNDLPGTIVNYLNSCVDLAKKYPESSVLVYGIKQLENIYAYEMIFDKVDNELLKIAYNHTYILPYIANKLLNSNIYSDILRNTLSNIIKNALLLNETDIITWCLFIGYKREISFDDDIVCKIIKSKDQMSNLLLYKILNSKARYIDIDYEHNQDFRRMNDNWILQYEIFIDTHQYDYPNDLDEGWMNILKKHKVSFVDLGAKFE